MAYRCAEGASLFFYSFALAGTHHDITIVEIQMRDAQPPDAFQHTHSAVIHQVEHQALLAR